MKTEHGVKSLDSNGVICGSMPLHINVAQWIYTTNRALSWSASKMKADKWLIQQKNGRQWQLSVDVDSCGFTGWAITQDCNGRGDDNVVPNSLIPVKWRQ